MPLFLITGTAGTGKSEVCKLLKKRGYEAYDTDDDGLARWQHKVTGYVHPKSSVKAAQRTADFIAEHSWNVPRDYLEKLASTSEGKVVFICGSLGNEAAVRDVFESVFALYVEDDILKQRLANRTNNDWGKQPHELQQTLKHHHTIYDNHTRLGDFIVDAARPVDEIVDEILRTTGA